jgi:hypothetical protein
MVFIVDQALPIAGMAVKSVGIEGIISTPFNAFKTVDACLLETKFLMGRS